MKEETILTIRINRKDGLYVAEGKTDFRSYLSIDELLAYIKYYLGVLD